MSISLPVISGPHCGAIHSSPVRWECNRADGHTGRHAAVESPLFGEKRAQLLAVWGGAA